MAKEEAQVIDENNIGEFVFEEGGDLVVNLQDVQEQKFEIIPKGTYVAEVDECQYGLSKSSGHPMFTMIWRIRDGEYTGRKLYQFLSFSPKALAGTKQNLNRIDPTLTTQAFKPQALANEGFFLGKVAKIRVDVSEYNGEDRSQIKGLIAVTDQSGFA